MPIIDPTTPSGPQKRPQMPIIDQVKIETRIEAPLKPTSRLKPAGRQGARMRRALNFGRSPQVPRLTPQQPGKGYPKANKDP